MKLGYYILLFILICRFDTAYTQAIDTIAADVDTISTATDTLPERPQRPPVDRPIVRISKDQPDLPISYGATDSSYLDLRKNQVHLFGDAYVKYGKYNLDAGYIIFDFDDNEAAAFDTLPGGLFMKNPAFSDGGNSFTASGLRYNFKTNKGIIYKAITQQGEFQVLGERTKFVSKEADSIYTKDQIFNKNALITTCTARRPHYGIRASRLKIIPNRLAVAGFSQLEIMGIPTPVILPFGFYPLIDGISSGIIFPADFESHPNLGLGVRGVGYFFPINEYMNLKVTGDFYTRGTHRIYANMNFKKRYKYSGSINLKYANNIVENPTDLSTVSNKGFSIQITRNQDPKAHPYQSLSGTINISTGNFYSVNYNDYENTTRNQYGSRFDYRNSLPGTPFALSVGLSHNQNTGTNAFNLTFPDARLTMNTIYPFKRKIQTGGERWYEKINLSGSSAFKSLVSTTDTMLFTPQTLDTIQMGMYNRASMSASFKALKYFNISPRISADQYVLFKSLDKRFDAALQLDSLTTTYDQDSVPTIVWDTTYGRVLEDLKYDFSTLHKFSMGVGVNTQLFATKNFSRGWLRGIRHTMRPSVNFSYTPSTYDRYKQVQYTSDPTVEDNFQQYNPYQGNPFNPSLSQESMSMNISISNNIEAKYYSRRDSTTKKFWILRSLNASTSYNFAADSLHWRPLSLSGNTPLTKYTNLALNARYDFYTMDENGRRTTETIWSQKKRPVEFRSFDLTLTTRFRMKDIFALFSDEKVKITSGLDEKSSTGATTLSSALENFSIQHSYAFKIQRTPAGTDSLYTNTHTLGVSGSVPLTSKWSLQVQSISYDFVRKDFIYPSFALSRDLHCWQMSFAWYPKSGVFGFNIGVKSSALSFLKYNYGQQSANRLSGLGFGR